MVGARINHVVTMRIVSIDQRRTCLMSMAGIVIALWSSLAFCDELTRTRFLEQYAEGEKKLIDAYSQVVISATVTERVKADGAPDILRVDYFASNRCLRMDCNQSGVRDSAPFVRRYSHICNPVSDSFTVDWNDATDRFVLRMKTPDHSSAAETIRLQCPFARAAYGLYELTVREAVTREDVEVVRFERGEERGKPFARVVTTIRTSDGKVIPFASFTFDPSRHWALTEYTRGSTTCRIEYAAGQGGVPVVKSMHRWRNSGDGVRDRETIVEVHSCVFKKTPGNRFTPADFGIETGEPYSFNTAYWIIAFGVVFLVGGWFVARRRLRS
jgi:hypothetical protein